jgi:hypothetical protein
VRSARSFLPLLGGLLLSGAAFAQAPRADLSLEELLAQRGWVAIQLRENAFNQLEADVVVEGEHRLRAQISTSFSKSVFDQSAVRAFGLSIEPTSIEITGAKGKQRLGTLQLQSLAFGETVVGPVTIFTADLSELISSGPGVAQVKAVIGSDLLTKYQAVLDIPTSKLYLRLR